MNNNEDKGRFLKDLVRGVPAGYGLTRSEQTVRELSRISRQLRSTRTQLPVTLSSPQTQVVQVPQERDNSNLEVELHTIAARQERTAENTEALVEQGEVANENLHNLVGLSIGHAQQNRVGIDQRDEMIGQGEITIDQLRSLVGNSQTANALLHTLGEQGFKNLLLQAGILQQGERGIAQGRELIQHGVLAAQERSHARGQRTKLIDSSRLAVAVLESLDNQGRKAYLQRLRIVSEVTQTRGAIQNLDHNLLKVGEQIHRDITVLQEQNAQLQEQNVQLHVQNALILEEAKEQTGILTDVRRVNQDHLAEARTQTQTLGTIQTLTAEQLAESRMQTHALGNLTAIGVAQLSTLTDLSEMMDTAVSVLGDIDYRISEVNMGLDRLNDTADQAVEHLGNISHALDLFVLSAREIQAQLRAVTEALHKPVTIKSQNLWNIGERCRQAGDISAATSKFLESHEDDPSNYKNYYSLALICLELGELDTARDFLSQSLVYATQSGPKAEVEVLHMLGKVEFMGHHHEEALEHLYRAYETDQNVFAVWYEIALVETALGDSQSAIGFLRALVRVAQAKSPEYITKIKAEPLFVRFVKQLAI